MTNSIIIKNCPAGQIVTSAIYPNMAGVYCRKEHKPCQDCICVIKNIATGCQKHIKGEKVFMANDVLEWLDIVEV